MEQLIWLTVTDNNNKTMTILYGTTDMLQVTDNNNRTMTILYGKTDMAYNN